MRPIFCISNGLLEGNADADALDGGAGLDTLLGGTGDDTLIGGAGNDILKGGKDFDTYRFSTGDGFDTVIDSDGKGKIVIDGINLTVAKETKAGSRLWETEEVAGKKFQIFLLSEPDGSTSLRIQNGVDRILVKNYVQGVLPITLQDAPLTAPPTTNRTIVGDFAPIDTDLASSILPADCASLTSRQVATAMIYSCEPGVPVTAWFCRTTM